MSTTTSAYIFMTSVRMFRNLLSIQYSIDNIWRFKPIDTIKVCKDDIYKDTDKISNELVDTLVHKEHIKEILKKI